MNKIAPQGQKLLRQVASYRYFVAYQYSKGFGSLELHRSAPINDWTAVCQVCECIQKRHEIKGVSLTNWILL